ncbi:enoyl-CoA delta isomerase 1, mitochondrial [Caerostris extrusa]|uniref:Enoyl-CoA delta isomerase 1, mitochondrial n=1 Tax=Caerostris extrusa TaxID=172846 RepID=A0AAV4PAU3_CAEEX|nr:enoyl-CoA delta isomerase 1, mitochondrial [Caerostris extrusa]
MALHHASFFYEDNSPWFKSDETETVLEYRHSLCADHQKEWYEIDDPGNEDSYTLFVNTSDLLQWLSSTIETPVVMEFKRWMTNNKRWMSNFLTGNLPGIATVIMKKPPVNSLNLEFLQKLTEVVKDLEDRKFRGLILTSDLPKVFCAGLDITELYNPQKERLEKFWEAFQIFWKTLYITPLITIAAVNGHAPAGGCVFALSCDHTIMVKSKCFIGLNETLLGFAAPKWVQLMLINACGNRKAEYALKMSKLFTPEEALESNIVHELVDSPSQLLPKAEEAMDLWLKVPALGLQMTKLSLRKSFVDDLISYEKEDVDDVVKTFLQDETQKILENYLESLKAKKK